MIVQQTINIRGYEFSLVPAEETKDILECYVRCEEFPHGLIVQHGMEVFVLINENWFSRRCETYKSDSLFAMARMFMEASYQDPQVMEQDRELFPDGTGLFTSDEDMEDNVRWWFHHGRFSYGVGNRHIWRIDEHTGNPVRFDRTLERLEFVKGLEPKRSMIRGIA